MSNNMQTNSCPYKPRKVLTEKQAKKEPVGSFYHPTEKTFRSGACPIGYSLKRGYNRKAYNKKDGTHIEKTYVDPVCVHNKGLPGKNTVEAKVIRINEKNSFDPFGYKTNNSANNRFKSLLEAIKVLSYSTVIRKLNALKIYLSHQTDEKSMKRYNIFDEDIKMLQKWRLENPDLYKHKDNNQVNNKMNIQGNSKMNIQGNNKMSK